MKLEKRSDGGGTEKPSAEPASNKQKPVFIYILILFTVALVLMLFSFFMHQRSNQQVLGELHSNVNALEELQDALDENLRLEKELSTAQKDLNRLQQELEARTEAEETASHSTNALLTLYLLQQQYTAGDYAACQETIAQFERESDPVFLPELDHAANSVTSPAERYQELKDAVSSKTSER